MHQQLTIDAAAAGVEFEEFLRSRLIANAPRSSLQAGEFGPIDEESIAKAAEIETKHRLGCSSGWRFITCPEANAKSAKLLLVSLNPGSRLSHYGDRPWSQEKGSAYRIESRDDKPAGSDTLQRQIQSMFEFLGLRDEEVFSAHYLPFRSPRRADLNRSAEAEAFAFRLWSWLKPKLHFERVVCIGTAEPGRSIARLFDANLEAKLPIGWGNYSARRYRLPDGRPLIALPHLSTFKVFNHSTSAEHLGKLFDV